MRLSKVFEALLSGTSQFPPLVPSNALKQVRELLPFLNRLTYHFVTTMPDQAFHLHPLLTKAPCADSGGVAACS